MGNEHYKKAEKIILDYTASSEWKQVKYLKWTSAEVQELLVKAIEKCEGKTSETSDATANIPYVSKSVDSAKATVCDHDRHYSEIDGFAYCNKCGEYMR